MAEFIHENIEPYFNYWVYVIIMMIGLWALIAKNNLIKKLIGLSIFQTAIILFYVSMGVKEGATIPILDHHGHEIAASEHRLFPEEGDHDSGHAKPAPDHGKSGSPDSHDEPGGDHGHAEAHHSNPDLIANPLPHVLMLTAIVVGVATLGVALAISQMIFKEFGTLEENEIMEEIKSSASDG
ncbi:MAG: cation:proton antiporter subunit C [Verrucomicrobiales bacterium]|nr:cation:proton antiporter subunit C [Verrucomicrobiales bacterium]